MKHSLIMSDVKSAFSASIGTGDGYNVSSRSQEKSNIRFYARSVKVKLNRVRLVPHI